MGSIHKSPNFFTAKPLFGLDVGKGSLKVVQLQPGSRGGNPKLLGYGAVRFDPNAISEGVVAKPEIIAEAAQSLFSGEIVGKISTKYCALTIPAYRTYTRSMQLPPLKDSELAEAVRLEAEEYIPVPLDEMYLDYTVISRDQTSTHVLAIAVPTAIIDSYLELAAVMGVEPLLIESTMVAIGRLFAQDAQSDTPSVIIDLGSFSSDISIYDQGVVTTGTVDVGGETFNQAIQEALGVSHAEAGIIKNKYGLNQSRRQKEISQALEPMLQKIMKEIKRLVRYHGEHYGDEHPIKQVITAGGGANMPGLSDYMTNELRLAVRAFDPWKEINGGKLQLPGAYDKPMFTAALGLALADSRKVFQ